ncbi:hypothetical protein [Phyllobacterium zundukense]|uniref:Uncharacterized protein n=1 Tax=Phyllobacterium zundukense TaxID=1867719 RepID=A0A2N9W063_9HYPH|nr:hypothetical protein [Phyllobacterium zundukense]ATU90629.1 hypothetical protein BLM14_02370 [Phyllobacterium zundukense]PIO45131.1 hypothetical protein B5P45_08790 [Phyllobacterium zundukense]
MKTVSRSSLIIIRSTTEADLLLDEVRASAARAHNWIASFSGEPLELFKQMKFGPVGFHPLDDRPLNIVEQINQTWTFATALLAAKQLLALHPEAGGYALAPGAHASQDLDIMSIEPDLVGAEIFAAVSVNSNRKLQKDLAKLALRGELNRYVFFMVPKFERTERLEQFEQHGVKVWSVTL